MALTIALVGNPNSGKTTLFNLLTGANQYVGNWPGVTVEKKEGYLRSNKEIKLADLPGIYSLSPYSPEEMISRSYLAENRPDAIINIVDGTNIERNLYLTTQLMDFGLPMVVAVNQMDMVQKSGDKLDVVALSKKLGLPVVAISALKNTGVDTLIQKAQEVAQKGLAPEPAKLNEHTENAIIEIENMLEHLPKESRRWYAIKALESDEAAFKEGEFAKLKAMGLSAIIESFEQLRNDEAESAIITDRYDLVEVFVRDSYRKKSVGLNTSDKIDRVVTNRVLALPIFAVVMFLVYYIAVTTVGAWVTDWTNEELFGDGFFLGKGKAAYEEATANYEEAEILKEAFESEAEKSGYDLQKDSFLQDAENLKVTAAWEDEEGEPVTKEVDIATYKEALTTLETEPEPEDFGRFVPGIPVVVENWMGEDATPWVKSLVLDGVVAGVGAVLGFVPQMFVLFFMLAILEGCGYMARVAFIMDRIFRRFGLSGKSFIPMLIGTGCSVPGIMASRTIENERDRRMTIVTTSFIPCGAKLPVIAMIAGALFGGAPWVSPLTYFIGMAAVIISGLILKKTRMFGGEASPFVMELPAYRLPAASNVLRSTWERGWSFIKKAGSIILLSSIVIWIISYVGFIDGRFVLVEDLNDGLAANIGNAIAWIFKPLGFGDWRSTVATTFGLVAKENVVNTFGILYRAPEIAEDGRQIWGMLAQTYTPAAGFSLLLFNLLCLPCFAAMGAIRREMNNARYTLFAFGYQTLFAYVVSLIVYQLWLLFTGASFTVASFIAVALLFAGIYLVVRPKQKLKGETL
ncbi:MAG TPA: ferrous iron transporter B [Clostridiales bacterium]|jgi:ferrous iron transport protein B|nr:ferrous iron transporter B [Clostridiales bacterium]